MLHIINQSNILEACLHFAKQGDAILLIEDGVLSALTAIKTVATVCVLKEDLEARGIIDRIRTTNIKVIDYQGFVDLTVQHHPIQSWN